MSKKAPKKVVATSGGAIVARMLATRMANGKALTKNDMVTMVETALLDRKALVDKLIDSRRDYDSEAGYPDDISAAHYRRIYDRDGIGRRVVGIFPQECWQEDPTIYESEDPKETEFESTWRELADRLNIWHYLHRVDEVSGIGRFGILLLGVSDGKPLSEPLEGVKVDQYLPSGSGSVSIPGKKVAKKSKLDLLYLRTFDESVVTVDQREFNMSSPRFGQPLFYSVIFADAAGSGKSTTMQTQRVHWSRVVHVADGLQLSEIYGTPRMQPVFNRLIDLKKIMVGASEMFWKGGFPGFSFELMPGVNESEFDVTSLKDEMEAYQNGLQRYLALTGVSVKSLAPQVADPTSQYDNCIRDICITLGVPKRIFEGSERGELASGQDARFWHQRLAQRQSKYVTPRIIRPFVDRLIAIGVLPPPKMGTGYTVLWSDLSTVTDQEKATVAGQVTATLAAYIGGSVDQIIPPAEFLTMILGMDADEVKTLIKAAEKWVAGKEADEPEETPDAPTAPSPGEAAGATDDEDTEEDDEDDGAGNGRVENFDPDQPRDEGGRFASGGGGGGKPSSGRQRRTRDQVASLKPSPKFIGSDLHTEQIYKGSSGWEESRRELHQDYLEDVKDGVPKGDGTVYMTGGGPAAGKTVALLNNPKTGIPGRKQAVHADPDAAKEWIPEFVAEKDSDQSAATRVHEESAHMSQAAIKEGLAAGHDVVYDSSGDGSVEKLETKVKRIREQGAKKVVAHYATIEVDEAIRRSDARAKETGRYVPHAYLKEVHASVNKVVVGAIERGIYDKLDLWDNTGASPVHVASYDKEEKGLKIHNQDAWDAFKKRGE